MGFEVFSDSLDKIPTNKKLLISTISPNSYGISTKDNQFKIALKSSDILLLDGVYFGAHYLLTTGKLIKKNQGPFVVDFFLKKANEKKLRVFFLGSTNEVLKLIENKIKKKYRRIEVRSYSPPFKEKFNINENKIMINEINSFNPNIIFVGMTCPKQEKWSFQQKSNLNTNIILNVGAAFDWIAGKQKKIKKIWWHLRLAWLIRTINRPEILKRYPNIGIYFKDLFLALFGLKKF